MTQKEYYEAMKRAVENKDGDKFEELYWQYQTDGEVSVEHSLHNKIDNLYDSYQSSK